MRTMVFSERIMDLIKEIVHDPILLGRVSTEACGEDLQVAQDLLDTLVANRETCVGMAANMIGVFKRIIVFDDEGKASVMLNPEILKQTDPYQTEEGCLSLLGGPRPVQRYRKIKVRYQTLQLQTRIKSFTGWTAQIIQHEIDHCNGILI